jgi:electron transport complex protein RnfG
MSKPQFQWALVRAMFVVGLVCSLLIATTYEVTRPVIARNREVALAEAVYQVLPGGAALQAYVMTAAGEVETSGEGERFFAAYDEQGTLVGWAIVAEGNGFADKLKLLYGYMPETQAIVGMAVLESRETPGLGDLIEKDPQFLANFEALSVALDEEGAVAEPIQWVKPGQKHHPWEIDGISGATISSKAVAQILHDSSLTWVPLLFSKQEAFVRSEPFEESQP